jgi:predicted ATPase/DNA-binding CsgD family transcriptional regulator
MVDQLPAASGGALIGRAGDVARAQRLVLDDGVRLLTLVGPGGVGKTRLALALADALRTHVDGTCFVDLAPVRDPSLVLPSIARVLAVPDTGGQGLDGALAEAIGTSRLLLVLDNVEQVAGAAPRLGALLAACPGLTVLATSREPLALAWEQLFEVGPLACPAADLTDWQAIGRAPAVALFVQQARSARPQFTLGAPNAAAVAELCRRLDGLPLAIELAAARLRLLSPEAIVVQLRQRPLALLAGGARDAPERHRTLREAIAWSYALLRPSQQALFRQLSVFVGGCTASAVEAVSDDRDAVAGLESLLDKHLLAVDDVDGTGEVDVRFRQLETIRDFGAEQLRTSGEADDTRARFARYLVDLVEELTPELYGPGQKRASQRLLAEYNNVRAVLDATGRAAAELGLEMAGSLWLFWRLQGFVGEGRARLATLLAAAGVETTGGRMQVERARPSRGLARALHAAGYLAFAQGAALEAEVLLTASLGVARDVGDAWSQSYALHGLGHTALLRGDFAEARRLYGERLAIAQKQRDEYALGQALNALGEVARCLDEPAVAREFYARSLEVRRRVGDTRGVAMGLANVGFVLLAQDEAEQARSVLIESLRLMRELGHQYGQAVCVAALAQLAVSESQPEVAARRLGAVAAGLEHVGNTLEPPDQLTYRRTTARARQALGDRFDAEFRIGRGLSLTDAAALGPTTRPPSAQPIPSDEASALSAREREVVALIARGCTSGDIAEALVITRRTADTHAAHIREKLGLRSRAEIAAWGIRHGLA